MPIRVDAEVIISARKMTVVIVGYGPFCEIGVDGELTLSTDAHAWLIARAESVIRAREVAARILALTDEDYTVNEIKERVGAVEIMCRPYRADAVDPVWEQMWKVDDVTIWVTVASGRIIGVRTGNIRIGGER